MTNKEALLWAENWFEKKNWASFPFQRDTWEACMHTRSGLLNAPTGSGKTYALFVGAMLYYKASQPEALLTTRLNGIRVLWITPIRALSKDIARACQEFCNDQGIPWRVAIRTGDTSTKDRASQKRNPPEVLITTPESLHLILASKGYADQLRHTKFVIADEWHELMGSKRAVLLELALSRLLPISDPVIWGISATIGNMEQAMEVLFGSTIEDRKPVFVRSAAVKDIEVIPIIPAAIESYPWSGHLGIKLVEQVLPILEKSTSTLLFTNTRAQAEIWYQNLLNAAPDLAGVIAMHHGSISRELRDWVEDALHEGRLKCVVCTSSLDLGVDFRPVETIIQVGSPKGVARFVQRAGRSGHQPGARSRIYFLPTNTLQLVECAALKSAIKANDMEDRMPYFRSFDVLAQYLVTLAVSDGFYPERVFEEVRKTFSFGSITREEWHWVLAFITTGGQSLEAYDEFKKVLIDTDGRYFVESRAIAMRHRLSIGAIVSDGMIAVKYQSGGHIGSVEEWFVAKLNPGDTFWFAGRALELIRIKEMTAQVKISKKKTGAIPSWQGGRMSLSAMLSVHLRQEIDKLARWKVDSVELQAVEPIANMQRKRSIIPEKGQFLIEKLQTREGCHLFCYPFEGRTVHEGMSALIAWRLSLFKPMTINIGLNDYGFELLCDQDIPIEEGLASNIFSTEDLLNDIQSSINKSELARRRFRDIASISGLVFKGFPGKYQKDKHLQSSSGLFFQVFQDYEADNLLLKEAFTEVMEFQVEEFRLRQALLRIQSQEIVLRYIEKPTPFAFPILVDRLREKLTNEKLEDRIRKMTLQLEKD